ncbi:MAG: group I intron-associated PD-(D/E)XK endonuclease [Candidatus Levyibacteriota bacterium]
MDRKTKGRLAEAKVITYLIEQGYEVYIPFSNNSKYDVIAIKDGVVKRISTKFTSVKKPSGSWVVEMRQIYRGKDIINIDKFDNKQCDLIAVYLGPIDKVVLVEASKATARGLHIKSDIIYGEVA